MQPIQWTTGELEALIQLLGSDFTEVIGPRIKDDAIVFDSISSISDLPKGWTDEQGPGTYRLKKRRDDALFGYVVGPHSWKNYGLPARDTLWRGEKQSGGISVEEVRPDTGKRAIIGLRACDMHAVDILDRVFIRGAFTDSRYKTRRDSVFTVAVNCTAAGRNCFCASMNSGPEVESGYDLLITELVQDEGCTYLVQSGTDAGAAVLKQIGGTSASASLTKESKKRIDACKTAMKKAVPVKDVRNRLRDNLTHDMWNAIADRCMSCGNCTMVCPTCFCTTVENHTDLTGSSNEAVRVWDSCFTMKHSWVHGGSVHQGTASRYRQWLTHKLSSWHDQFDTSGCTGCGRCITWCPVGIDFTEELSRLEEGEK
jgi:ferredoxin